MTWLACGFTTAANSGAAAAEPLSSQLLLVAPPPTTQPSDVPPDAPPDAPRRTAPNEYRSDPSKNATSGGARVPASGNVELAPIGRLTSDIAPAGGELPHDYAAAALAADAAPPTDVNFPVRTNAPFYSTPRAADFIHRPLYFEERALERDGRNYGLAQPVVSGLHFFGTLPTLPYRMGAQPPARPLYTGNGVNIPGDHLSRRDRIRGLATQAGASTGAILIIP